MKKTNDCKKLMKMSLFLSLLSLGALYYITNNIYNDNLTSELDSLVRTHKIENYSIEKERANLTTFKYRVRVTYEDSLKGKYPSEFYLTRPIFSIEKMDIEFENQK
ncbi:MULTISPECIES: hypothetical protein [Enterococcus]|uniref:hypothetical protein n=1 Tax=Enterococcus TaxID=1350 RepID=UPI000A33E239|nr:MULTISPECIES: hypothetical protein [Enterococcus]EME8160805.1 hypothetical protein [Enterococcus faecium]OTO22169.1 hypothetical protein A5816_002841 [Enterococcus sp. 3G1_DIV0629]PEH49758.1 hypothetical protein CRM75_01020 [Enterococcus faecium]